LLFFYLMCLVLDECQNCFETSSVQLFQKLWRLNLCR
jgi:hypothetical protein